VRLQRGNQLLQGACGVADSVDRCQKPISPQRHRVTEIDD
jgi:hypothetical protein